VATRVETVNAWQEATRERAHRQQPPPCTCGVCSGARYSSSPVVLDQPVRRSPASQRALLGMRRKPGRTLGRTLAWPCVPCAWCWPLVDAPQFAPPAAAAAAAAATEAARPWLEPNAEGTRVNSAGAGGVLPALVSASQGARSSSRMTLDARSSAAMEVSAREAMPGVADKRSYVFVGPGGRLLLSHCALAKQPSSGNTRCVVVVVVVSTAGVESVRMGHTPCTPCASVLLRRADCG
jgi:hypothetical protein